MKPKLRGQLHAWAVVDVDGTVCWGLTFRKRGDALLHPGLTSGRTVVRVEAVKPKPRKARRVRRCN